MAYYMVTYGEYEIREAYIGLTEDEAITNARTMINKWPEYADMSNEEIIDGLRENQAFEFDMVQVDAEFEDHQLSLERIIWLYYNKSTPIHLC